MVLIRELGTTYVKKDERSTQQKVLIPKKLGLWTPTAAIQVWLPRYNTADTLRAGHLGDRSRGRGRRASRHRPPEPSCKFPPSSRRGPTAAQDQRPAAQPTWLSTIRQKTQRRSASSYPCHHGSSNLIHSSTRWPRSIDGRDADRPRVPPSCRGRRLLPTRGGDVELYDLGLFRTAALD